MPILKEPLTEQDKANEIVLAHFENCEISPDEKDFLRSLNPDVFHSACKWAIKNMTGTVGVSRRGQNTEGYRKAQAVICAVSEA